MGSRVDRPFLAQNRPVDVSGIGQVPGLVEADMSKWGITLRSSVAVVLCLLPNAVAWSQPGPNGRPAQVRTVQGSWVPVASIAGFVGPLMETCAVTDLSMAVLNDGKVIYTGAFGPGASSSGAPLEPLTVFRAASLSKPVFAYLVMKLVDRNLLDLDTPLFRYVPKPVFTYPGYQDLRYDRRYEVITARLVLSHQTGFPNWRWQNPTERLDIRFFPGKRFGYSGEGYQYLQFIVEKKLGKGLAQIARDEVFLPLGMTQTSFELEERFEGHIAADLSRAPAFLKDKMRTEASAAGSLLTTAADYGRFVTAVLNGEGLSPRSGKEMLRPQVRITSRRLLGPEAAKTDDNTTGLSWCLGWGRFETGLGDAIFHVGQETGCENYVVVFLREKVGMVILSAGEGREAISPKLVARVIGDGYSPFHWLGE
jgi:D-alanyl-D-alanine-carboxypeptidase/D-alanyl-D-alanine-endopeptidase